MNGFTKAVYVLKSHHTLCLDPCGGKPVMIKELSLRTGELELEADRRCVLQPWADESSKEDLDVALYPDMPNG